jgi:hypothetical protein
MYNVLIQPDFTVHNNLNFWKIKIPLKIKVFTWYLHRGMILTKDNFAKCNWQGSKKSMSFIIMTILFNLYSFSAARSIWPASQIDSTLYWPHSVANIFGNLLNGVDNRFKLLIRVGEQLFDHCGYVEITKFLIISLLLRCMLPTDAQLRSLFVVASTTCGESWPLYGGIYMVRGYGEGYFFATRMATWSKDWPSVYMFYFLFQQYCELRSVLDVFFFFLICASVCILPMHRSGVILM